MAKTKNNQAAKADEDNQPVKAGVDKKLAKAGVDKEPTKADENKQPVKAGAGADKKPVKADTGADKKLAKAGSRPVKWEYVWIDGNNKLRSKTRVIETDIRPTKWSYDGSHTSQADAELSEMNLTPIKTHISDAETIVRANIVLCEAVDQKGTPAANNNYRTYYDSLQRVKHLEPLFGMDQEYYIQAIPDNASVYKSGLFYCGVETNNSTEHHLCRKIAQDHLDLCLDFGIPMMGINAKELNNQWGFQLKSADAPHDLWVARFLLHRICEQHGVICTLDPTPIVRPEVNGSGCHHNFSTAAMRRRPKFKGELAGSAMIKKCVEHLEKAHRSDIKHMGKGNNRRLTGRNKTSSLKVFTSGVGDRTASVRISNPTETDEFGYFEDRRPGANCDPYLTATVILDAALHASEEAQTK